MFVCALKNKFDGSIKGKEFIGGIIRIIAMSNLVT